MASLTTPRAIQPIHCISNLCSCSYETKLKITIATAVTTVALGILTSLPLLITAGFLTGTYAIYKTFQHVDLLKRLKAVADDAFDKALSLRGRTTNISASPRRTSPNENITQPVQDTLHSSLKAAERKSRELESAILEKKQELLTIVSLLNAQKAANQNLDTKNKQLEEQHTTITAELENQKKALENANASIKEQKQLLTERDNTITEQIQHIEDLLGQIANIEEELSTSGETVRIRASHKVLHYMIKIIEEFCRGVLLGIREMTDEHRTYWEGCYISMITSIRAFAETVGVFHLLSNITNAAQSPSKILSEMLALGPINALQGTPATPARHEFPSLSPDPIQVSPTTAAASPNGT